MGRLTSFRSADGRPQEGFALLVVVVLLFAVGVTAAATYQIVLGESRLAGFNRDAERAQIIAEAGAMRLLGDAIDGPPPQTIYDFGGGGAQARVAEASARKVLEDASTWTELWRIRSVGRITDPRFFDFPAVREVSRYARMRTPPFDRLGAVVTAREGLGADPAVALDSDFDIAGGDAATSGMCPHQGGAIPDVAAGGTIQNCSGDCDNYGSAAALLQNLQLPSWAVLTHADYRADHEVSGSGWTFAGLGVAADTFPSIRVQGNLSAGTGHSGRGALIVTGEVSFSAAFSWDGIILAAEIQDLVSTPALQLRGIVAEVNPSGTTLETPLVLDRGSIRYHSCNVAAAGTSIGILNPETAAWWSAF